MSSAKVSDSYAVRDGDLERDAAEILRLWSLLPGDTPPQREKLDWFYLQNPAGKGDVLFLEYLPEGRFVGVVCLGRRAIHANGNQYQGAVFGDFAIEPKHRSLGPALFFQKAFLRVARERFQLVYGFPNALSGRVRVFGGFKLDTELAIFVMPLDFGFYMQRYMPRVLAKPAGAIASLAARQRLILATRSVRCKYRSVSCDADFLDTLWQRVSKAAKGLGTRDAEYLQWRLDANPYQRFQFFAIADLSGAPAGFAAFARQPDGGISVIDHLSVSSDAIVAVLSMLALAEGQGAKSMTMTLSPGESDAIARMREIGFSERANNPYFLSLGESVPPDLKRSDVRLNICDNDA